MKEALLLVSVAGVLYGLWLLLSFTFSMIDVWHQREASAAEPRRGGAEQAEGMDDC